MLQSQTGTFLHSLHCGSYTGEGGWRSVQAPQSWWLPRGTFCGDVLRYRFTRFEEAQHLVQQKPAFAGAAALRCSLLLLVEGEVTALDDVADLPGAFQDFLRNFLERAAFEGLEVRALGDLVDRIVHEIFFDAITAADESRFDHEPLRVAPVLEIDRHPGLVK